MTLRIALTLAALSLAAPHPAETLTFNNTASKIEITGIKKDGSHDGGFKRFAGRIELADAKLINAKVTFEIQMESLFTDNDKLTAYLKSPESFDVRTYPKMKFTSTAFRSIAGDNGFTHFMYGDLTLHGTTKSIRLPIRMERTETGMTLTGKLTIQRKAFGISDTDGRINNDLTLMLSFQAGR